MIEVIIWIVVVLISLMYTWQNLHIAVDRLHWLRETERNGAMELTARRNIRQDRISITICGLFLLAGLAALLQGWLETDFATVLRIVTRWGLLGGVILITIQSRINRQHLQQVVDVEMEREREEQT